MCPEICWTDYCRLGLNKPLVWILLNVFYRKNCSTSYVAFFFNIFWIKPRNIQQFKNDLIKYFIVIVNKHGLVSIILLDFKKTLTFQFFWPQIF